MQKMFSKIFHGLAFLAGFCLTVSNTVKISLSVWVSVFEVGTPIPFLGLEAAMQGTMTEADALLEDALRMIRVDAYRLATIVNAYSQCAKALQIRLMFDHKSPRLAERQIRMYNNLHNALEELARVRDKRKVTKFGRPTDLMSIYLTTYIDKVVKRSERILEEIKIPF